MKFKNTTSERIKFCLGYKHGYDWVTVSPGESKDIVDEEEERALIHGLEKCEVKAVASSVGKKKVETKKVKKRKK